MLLTWISQCTLILLRTWCWATQTDIEPLTYYKCHRYMLLPCTPYLCSHSFFIPFWHPSFLYSAQKYIIVPTVYKIKSGFLKSSGSPNTKTACLRWHHLFLQTRNSSVLWYFNRGSAPRTTYPMFPLFLF